jgi:hypothetical protein
MGVNLLGKQTHRCLRNHTMQGHRVNCFSSHFLYYTIKGTFLLL